jgi:hypothetical protein
MMKSVCLRRWMAGGVVITAGFGESSEAHGKELQQALLEAAKPYLLRIIGPNCLGILVPGIGLNASFAHLGPAKDRLRHPIRGHRHLRDRLGRAAPHWLLPWFVPRNFLKKVKLRLLS